MSRTLQAGAIAVKLVDGSPRILVVSAKKNPGHWIFPKGHIELGESPQQTSVRELCEEAGVQGDALERVGVLEFQAGAELLTVEHFLVRFLDQVGPGDGRKCQWCTYEEARQLLSFEETKRLLATAQPLIAHHFG